MHGLLPADALLKVKKLRINNALLLNKPSELGSDTRMLTNIMLVAKGRIMSRYQDNIEISAYNSDTEQYRLVRIERVIGYLCALSEHYNNEKLLSKIAQLHDHKGMLTVTWCSEPSAGEKELISKTWLSGIGDGADNVEHKRI